MSNENFEKLKKDMATYLVYHEKAVNHEVLHTMQIPYDYILQNYKDEIETYKQLMDTTYGVGAAEFIHCKECIYRGSQECICSPFYPEDYFYCAKGDNRR